MQSYGSQNHGGDSETIDPGDIWRGMQASSPIALIGQISQDDFRFV